MENYKVQNLVSSKEIFSERNLTDANFEGATLDGLDFSNSILEGANFEGASVKGTIFNGVEIRGLLSEKQMMEANLEGCYFDHVRYKCKSNKLVPVDIHAEPNPIIVKINESMHQGFYFLPDDD